MNDDTFPVQMSTTAAVRLEVSGLQCLKLHFKRNLTRRNEERRGYRTSVPPAFTALGAYDVHAGSQSVLGVLGCTHMQRLLITIHHRTQFATHHVHNGNAGQVQLGDCPFRGYLILPNQS